MLRLGIVAGGTLGVYLLLGAVLAGPAARSDTARRRAPKLGSTLLDVLDRAGFVDARSPHALAATILAGAAGCLGATMIFGAWIPAAITAGFAATAPAAIRRNSRRKRHDLAGQAWPRIISEIRVLTASAGHSVPHALFEAGRRAPVEFRDAFDAAHREWLLSTDFARTTRVLTDLLADPCADVACETLLVAHEVGGTDLDARLVALAQDRATDVAIRSDAVARQAGARFARRFVLLVPLGMAAAGLSMGTGRHAYGTPMGQLLTGFGVLVVIACWIWAGRIMTMPTDSRVFGR